MSRRERVATIRISPHSRAWLLGSVAARRLSMTEVGVSVTGCVAGVVISASAIIREQPVTPTQWLVFVAVPLMLAGFGWALVWQEMRVADSRATGASQREAVKHASPLSHLGRGRRRLAIAAFGFGWLSALTAWPALSHGGPTSPSAGCPYRLSNHGSYSCVTSAQFARAGAAEQRFLTGVLIGFFAYSGASAAASLDEQRRYRASEA